MYKPLPTVRFVNNVRFIPCKQVFYKYGILFSHVSRPEESTKPKKRQRVTPQLPTASSDEYAKWKGAPTTLLQSINEDDSVSKECFPVMDESVDKKVNLS